MGLNVDVLTNSDSRWSGCSVVSEYVGPPSAVAYCTSCFTFLIYPKFAPKNIC